LGLRECVQNQLPLSTPASPNRDIRGFLIPGGLMAGRTLSDHALFAGIHKLGYPITRAQFDALPDERKEKLEDDVIQDIQLNRAAETGFDPTWGEFDNRPERQNPYNLYGRFGPDGGKYRLRPTYTGTTGPGGPTAPSDPPEEEKIAAN
jgi:hypothetical protein